jgi:HEPN domain-containing protein
MMTKEDHINHWVNTAQYDWTGAESAFDTKNYLHCLFWAHLVLEKLAKAHWVKNHQENIPPKVHTVVWLLEQSNINLGEDFMKFLELFNRFQLSARYPDYINDMYKVCTKDYTTAQLEKVREVRQCLIEMLQSE